MPGSNVPLPCRPGHRFAQPGLRRSADSEPIYAQRRLPDADRNALSVLAAGADARVEREIVADHRHARERVGTVADQRRTLDRIGELAVLDFPGLGCGENELAVGDVDLSAAEVSCIEAVG